MLSEKLKARGAFVYSATLNPWRFDKARNMAMDHIPEDVDICVSNDLDEVFEPGWRAKLEEAWTPQTTRASYLFTCTYRPNGEPDKQFPMEKIHSRKNYQWIHPVHEILQYTGAEPEQRSWVNGMVLNHYPDDSKPRTQYLPLLELCLEENPDDDRTAFWLGREYMYHGKYDKAIPTLKNYLCMPSAQWDEERSAAMRFIGRSYQMINNLEEAKNWMLRAVAECPHVREPYLYMARVGYLMNNWPMVLFAVDKGLAITARSGSYLLELEAWGWELYDLGGIAYFNLGLFEKAKEYAAKASELAPYDQRLKNNLTIVEGVLKRKGQAHEQV